MHSRNKQTRSIGRIGLPLIVALGSAVAMLAQEQAPARPPAPYVFRSAQAIGDLIRSLQMTPRTSDIVRSDHLPFNVNVVSERAAQAALFEVHDTRDHVFLVLDGTTRIDVGGELESPRSTGPGEWRAPGCKGYESLTMVKGDLLTIPRGTPHRRTTEKSVTILGISVSAPMPQK